MRPTLITKQCPRLMTKYCIWSVMQMPAECRQLHCFKASVATAPCRAEGRFEHAAGSMHKQKAGQCDHRRQTRQYPVACELCGGSCSQAGSHIFQLTLFSGVQHCFSTLQAAQNRSVAMQLKPTTTATVQTVQEGSPTTWPGCCSCCCCASAAVQATAWCTCVAAHRSSVWRHFWMY